MAADEKKYRNGVQFGYTQAVRVVFPPRLDKPEQIGGEGDPKYEVTIAFPEDHPDYPMLYGLTQELAEEAFGEGTDISTFDEDRIKFVSGDAMYEEYLNRSEAEGGSKDYPFLKGQIVMKLRSKNPITVFDVRRRNAESGKLDKISDKDEIRSTIYSGCYVALNVTLSSYRASKRPGITVYPEQICFVHDGDRLGGFNKDDGSSFDQVQGAISDKDPTGGEE